MTIAIRSSAFASGAVIPRVYTGDGQDRSPPLEWSQIPLAARELVLICDDPDAPTPQPWVHWLLYGLPPDIHSLPEGLPTTPTLTTPPGARQGRNSWRSGAVIGYRGPAPPPGHGVHHYHFRLYALDAPLGLAPGVDRQTLERAMAGHVLDQGDLVGTYSR
jgi:Raf kinase inhibitor-like YbhB/YbcL family protein